MSEEKHESTEVSLESAIGELEKKVDTLEAPKVEKNISDEQDEDWFERAKAALEEEERDWSEKVKQAAERGKASIERQVETLRDYLPDPDRFLEERLKEYSDGIQAISKALAKEGAQLDLAVLLDQLGGLAERKAGKYEEKLAWAKKTADEDPYFFVVTHYNTYAKLKEAPQLLEEALIGCINRGNFEVLWHGYENLKTQTFFEREVDRAFEKIKDNSDYTYLLILRLSERNPELLKKKVFLAVLPSLFEKNIVEEKPLYSAHYLLFKNEPWFKESLERGFSKLCEKSPIRALKFLSESGNKTQLWEEPAIKTRVISQVERLMGGSEIEAIRYAEVYKDFPEYRTLLKQAVFTPDKYPPMDMLKLYKNYKDVCTEKELTEIFKNDVVPNLLPSDLKDLVEALSTHKDSMPESAFPFIMDAAIFAVPLSVIKSYKEYKNYPDAKKYFNRAANVTSPLEARLVLQIIANKSVDELPFENRETYIDKIVKQVILYNPVDAVTYASVYQDLPNGKSLLKLAEQRALVSTALKRLPYKSEVESEAELMGGDPALEWMAQNALLIERTWLPATLSDGEYGEAVAMICRNLYLNGQDAADFNEKTVKKTYKEILKTREIYKNKPLFKGRNVLVASHVEKWKTGKDRFGKQALVEGIKTQQGQGTELYHYEPKENALEELQKTKKDILKKLETIPSPMTFLFDGHGNSDGIYLSDGHLEDLQAKGSNGVVETQLTIKITVQELAETLQARTKRFGKRKVSNDILIFDACYNHNFVRSLYENLDSLDAGKPITLGAAEYGEVSRSHIENPYGNTFFENLLKDGNATFEDIWNLPYDETYNPSLYIPSKDTPQQVAELDEEGPETGQAA